ncbi:ATP-binding protein [Virgibacillus oceani]
MPPNKNKTKSIFILIAIMLALTGFRLLWLFYHAPTTDQPVAEDGLLDLREHDLNDDQTVTLKGEWAFFPDSLVENTQQLPSNISENIRDISGGADEDSHQFGTYYLKILVDEAADADHLFSIRMPSANTASALFVNGHLIDQSGDVAAVENNHGGQGNPYVASFSEESNEIDIMLQVSNFDTNEGIGISSPIKFGTSQAITSSKNLEDVLLITMVVILVLHSIYSLLIYIFISRKKIMLFFAIGFLFPAIDEMLTYDSATMEWLHLNYEWSFKLKELIYLGAALFLVQIMRNLLRISKEYKRFRWLTVLYGICALLIVVLPLNYLIQINTMFFILYFISFVAVVPLALKEYFRFKDESIFIAIVVVGTTSGIVWGLIKAVSTVEIPFYPFDYLMAFLGFAVFWFKRFYRQNKQVVDLVDELEQADKKKDEFLANTSHELRNPLHGVMNIAQTVLDDRKGDLSEENKKNLQLLVSVGQHMTFTLNDLLDVTRLREHRIILEKENTDLRTVSLGTLDMLHFMTDRKEIQFRMDIPRSFPKVHADENRLIQILFNLLHNAVKNTNSGTITVSADHKNKMATVYVKDTGVGMSKETLNNVFLPYEQEDSGMTSKGGGIGLGLNICKQLIELHGGEISADSTVGKGTVFSFTLPLAKSTAEEIKSRSQTAAVIDDDRGLVIMNAEPSISERVSLSGEDKAKF